MRSRHSLLLDSSRCVVCHSRGRAHCEPREHLAYSTVRFECRSCGAEIEEDCVPGCEGIGLVESLLSDLPHL